MILPKCNGHALLQAFLRSELDDDREREFASHLNHCAICREQIESDDASKALWHEAQMFLTESRLSSRFTSVDRFDLIEREPLIQSVLGMLGPTDDPDMLGRIGPYEVLGVVGSGGMGVVLKAIDKSLDRTVAIKVLAPHLAISGSAKKRFAREAKAAAAVLHPNVIAVHSVCADHLPPYLVMPFIRGSSLQKRLDDQGPFRVVEILRIGVQIAAGLAASHEQGLVHRDIKPANVLLEDGVERVTITDFGLARAIDDASLTKSGMIAGTPMYMSPEQSRGEPVDQSSDLFSLGSVLYAISAGRPPFRAESTYGVMKRIADESATSIREVNPEIPEWLERMIAWLMQKDPKERPKSAETVECLLRQCLAHVEQPHLTSLPHDLVGSKSRRSPFSTWRIIMPITCFTAMLIPLEWYLTTQVDPRDSNSKSPSSNPKQGIVKGNADLDDYEISLRGMDDISQMQMSTQFDMARMPMQQQSFQQFGQTTNNGSVSGGAGGAGGGFGQAYKKPNFGIALEVKPKGKQDNKFVEIGSAIRIMESDGAVSESPTLGPVVHRFADFEKQYPGALCTYLYRESKSSPKQITGELRINSGRRVEVQFEGTKKQSKPVGKESITLESVKLDKEGVQVVISFPELTAVRNAKSPQEQFQATISNQSAYLAVIEDSDGAVLAPTSGTNLNNNVQSSFSFSNVNGAQTVQGKAGSPKNPSQTFSFKPLPQGTKIKRIVATFTDRDGDIKVLPFSIPIQNATSN